MANDIQKRIAELLPGLMKEPRLYVHDIDWQKGTALVIEADEAFFRNAVFLDGRALKSVKVGAHVRLEQLYQILGKDAAGLRPARFIFHVGHAGSTLISRLLDEAPGVLGLREPLVLRNFSAVRNAMRTGKVPANQTAFGESLRRSYKLLARTFRPGDVAVIKATSICNNLAASLLGFNQDNRALCLYIPLETMLANMLAKDEAGDLAGFADVRLHGLKSHFPAIDIDPKKLDRAELAAMSWVAEIYEMFRLSEHPAGAQATFMNFDTFLADPETGIGEVLTALNLSNDKATQKTLSASSVFSSYAKQPGYPYNPKDREAGIETAKQSHRKDIETGLAFAEDLGQRHPALKKAFEKFPLK